jgi:hypothetical protein
MGDAKQRRAAIKAAQPLCVICGGCRPTETIEHCPPRVAFLEKQGPDLFEFGACGACNRGSRNDDLLFGFMVRLGGALDSRSEGLFRAVRRQFPGLLDRVLEKSANEGRGFFRRLGLKPAPGETHKDLPIAKLTPEMKVAGGRVAGKLTRVLYHRHTGVIFPGDGDVSFTYYTNATLQERGSIPQLEFSSQFNFASEPIRLAKRDLSQQFDYRIRLSDDRRFGILDASFGPSLGIQTIFHVEPGLLRESAALIAAKHPDKPWPILFV